MRLSLPKKLSKDEWVRQTRERLTPVLAEIDAFQGSTFLDLCELVLMVAERTDGSIKFTHPRVTVHIKQLRRSAVVFARKESS